MSETGKIPVSENDAQQNFLEFVGNNGECVDISGTWLTYKRDTLSDPWDEPQTTVIRQTGCDTSGDLVSTVVGNTIDWSFDKDCQTISGNGIITSSYSGIGTLTSSYMEGTYQEEGCHGYMIGYWKAEKDVIGE